MNKSGLSKNNQIPNVSMSEAKLSSEVGIVKVKELKPTTHVLLPARTLDAAVPALLTFLPFSPGDSDTPIKLHIYLNSIEKGAYRILDMFDPDDVEVSLNPDTLDRCKGSYTLFMAKLLHRFIGDLPKDTYKVMFMNEDVFIHNVADFLQESSKGRVRCKNSFVLTAPCIKPVYQEVKGDWNLEEARYCDWWGFTIEGLYSVIGQLERMRENLVKMEQKEITVGSGPLATAALSVVTDTPIKFSTTATAYIVTEEKSKTGSLENSFNNLAVALFSNKERISGTEYEEKSNTDSSSG